MKKMSKILALTAAIALVLGLVPTLGPVSAAAFTETSMRLDRMTAGYADNDILVVVKPATTNTEGNVRVNFDSFGVDSTPANVTTSTSGLPSTYQGETLTAWPSIGGTASAVAGTTVTFTSGDLTVGTLYGFYITAGVDNPGSTGMYINRISTLTGGGATIDTARVAVRIIADDQIVITAAVPPYFDFQLDGNTDSFTTDLDPSNIISTGGRDVTIKTNAQDGWIAWLKSANTSLDSASTGETIETIGTVNGSPSSLTTGQDGYVLDVDLDTDSGTGDGTVSIAPEYDGASDEGGTLSSDYEEIATSDGTTDGDVITLTAKATVSPIKAAAEDYTDTWTVIGAANF
jgi:hypothetical protein